MKNDMSIFEERARRADRAAALRILEKAGKGNPPMPGDELPAKRQTRRPRRKKPVQGAVAPRK